MSAQQAVVGIIADMTGRDSSEITGDTRLAEDLQIKSVNRIELTVRIEDQLGAVLTVSDILRAKTVADVAGLVDQHAPTTG